MKASHQVPTTAKPARLPRRLLVLALGLGAGPALAQHPVVPQALPAATDTVRRVVELPTAELDSLAAAPLVPAVDSARLLWLQTPATLYELVGDRMGCLQSDMPLHYNEAVLAYVRLFTERQRGYTQRVLEREQFYFPTFEKYLAQYNLPLDLKYLSVVESALIPTAKSAVGAVGLWQFMPPTAGDLRLKRDEWVDERMHPEKATEAACKHLRYLYGLFHDWELVLAAYNWGAGNVHRVMRRTGKKTFWELYSHLPAETRNYVPTFTAVLYAMKYAPEYRLNDAALRYQRFETLDTLGLRGQAFDLRRLSRALGYADSSAIGRYNPEVRHGELPAGYRPYVLRFPSAAREQLAGVDRATLLAYCQPAAELPRPLLARTVYLSGYGPAPTLAASASHSAAPRYRRVYYTVRRGQTLAAVAERFDVSAAQLRHWNNLPKNAQPRPGRELVVLRPLPAAETAPALLVAATPAPLPHSLHLATPADSVSQALAAANARFAREALERAQQEAAMAKELVARQRQQALRAVAQQRAQAAKAAALAKAASQEKANPPVLAAAAPATETPVAMLAAAPDPVVPTADSAATPPRGSRLARPASPRAALEEKAALAGHQASLPEPAAKPTFYVVRPGDNLTKVAQANNLSLSQLREWNQLPAAGGVQAGQRLRLAAPPAAPDHVAVRTAPHPALRTITHVVQPKDTLYSISRQFSVSVAELKRLNHLKSDAVQSGQKLVVPAS
ncbi:LysM peptidoglycan-binding domain-containing protein [Hymenobacter sp. RP-2-7]|uniref:LysM peptidoglycan-binding domain-containing protein n=1 Tax=Hymenobacter polaris TaxID=2682546 RepID=A0A7Y0AFP5_9BACT|nr:LysM peptidoglycan-binding domain-containing protein [Hymenobacter polaris]NML66513.1 LysM peptidoglycan-binding domain-containing protein [Hymenobacter polaris]